jgi:hypothetical protein
MAREPAAVDDTPTRASVADRGPGRRGAVTSSGRRRAGTPATGPIRLAAASTLLAGLLAALVVFVLVAMLLVLAGGNQSAASASTCAMTPDNNDAPPQSLIATYQHAAADYHLGDHGWAVLAAINRIETRFGQNLAVSSKGAVGWMQFLPGTWSAYGVDADGDGKADPYDPEDAIHGAANLLRASGAPGDWHAAIWAYNPSDAYVRDVLDHASSYVGGCSAWTLSAPQGPRGGEAELRPDGTVDPDVPGAPQAVKRMIEAANLIANKPYKWGGGHGAWEDDGYDCSGYTSYVLHAAGLLDAPRTAAGFMTWGQHGVGNWVTVWATTQSEPDHVFMIIAGRRFDSGGSDRQGSAWRKDSDTRSISGFEPRTIPGL